MSTRTVPIRRYGLLHEFYSSGNDADEQREIALARWRAAVANEHYTPLADPDTELHHEVIPLEWWNPMSQQFELAPDRVWRVIGHVVPEGTPIPPGYDPKHIVVTVPTDTPS